MCGIVGMIDTSTSGFFSGDKQVFAGMLMLNSFRGAHSTGAFGLLKLGKADVYKTIGDPYNFLNCDPSGEFFTRMVNRYWGVVGHGRLATQGAVSVKNAHPFINRNITLVHNGTLTNFKELQKEFGTNYEVDSNMVAYLIAEMGLKEALKEIKGAFTLVYYDSELETLNLIRNHERPLKLASYTWEDKLAFASEDHVLHWAGKKGTPVKEIADLPTFQWLKLKREGTKLLRDSEYIGVKTTYNYPKHQPYFSDGDYSDYDVVQKRYDSRPKPAALVLPPQETMNQHPIIYYKDKSLGVGDEVEFIVTSISEEKYEATNETKVSVQGELEGQHYTHIVSRVEGTETDIYSLMDDKQEKMMLRGTVKAMVVVSNQNDRYQHRIFVANLKSVTPKDLIAKVNEEKDKGGNVIPFVPPQLGTSKTGTQISDQAVLRTITGEFIPAKKFKQMSLLGCKTCNGTPMIEDHLGTLIKDGYIYCKNCVEAHGNTYTTVSNVQ